MKICASCAAENDDTRVFCLNCANRLPLPIPGSKPGLPVPSPESSGASAPKIHMTQAPKKPAKLRQAGTRPSTILFRFLFLLGLGALGVAVYLVLQPPARIPASVQPMTAPELAQWATFLQTASKSSGGAWQGDVNSINRFLRASVRLHPIENPLGIKVAFERCYVELLDGRMDFTMQVAVQGRSVYLRVALAPEPVGGKVGVRVVDAALGQLPIPGPLAKYLLPLWNPCFDSLENVLAVFKDAKSVEVTSKRIVVRWPDASSR